MHGFAIYVKEVPPFWVTSISSVSIIVLFTIHSSFWCFFILYRLGSLNQLSSLWNSPWHLAIAEAFAKRNLYFLSYASANYCQSKIVLTIHGSDSGEKSPSKDMKIFFPAFKFVVISSCTWKPNPLGLGNCSAPNFCKISFRYFCSLFIGT